TAEGAPLPPPSVNNFTPTSAVAGSGPVTLTVNGADFVAGSFITVNGLAISTTMLSTTQLSGTLSTTQLQTVASLLIDVTTAGVGSVVAGTFSVVNGSPTLTNVNPASGVQGTAPTVTLTGTNFLTGATIGITGTGVTTSNAVVNLTTITATFTI